MADPSSIPGRTRLFLLGRVDLVSPGGESLTSEITQPKRQALLAYLARSPGTFRRRDTLLALLWPEFDEERSRRALRAALHYLRSALGPDVLVGRGQEEVGLDPDRIVVDVREFEAALERGDEERALALFAGDFLPGLHVSDALEFQTWVDAERRTLRRRATEAALSLSTDAATKGVREPALRWAHRAAELQPFDEGVARHLMELLARAGDRAGAIRSFERFAARLHDELELPPSPELEALAEAIRDSGDRLDPLRESSPTRIGSGAAFGRGTPPLPVRPRRRWRRALLIGAVGLVAGLTGVAGTGLLETGVSTEPAAARPVMRILPPRVLAPDPEATFLAAVATDWAGRALAGPGRLSVVESGWAEADVASRRGETPTPTLRLQITVFGAPGDLRFEVSLRIRSDSGRVEQIDTVVVDPADPYATTDAVRWTVLSRLGRHFPPGWLPAAGTLRPLPRREAYEEFLLALEDEREDRGGFARRRLARARELDSTFVAAALREVVLHAAARRVSNETRDLFSGLAPLRARMSHVERLQMQYVQGVLTQRPEWGYPALSEAAEAIPDRMLPLVAVEAMALGRYAEALAALRRLPDPRDANWGHRFNIITSLHAVGRYEEELAEIEEAREIIRHPALGIVHVRSLAALGRMDAIDSLFEARRDESNALAGLFQMMWVTSAELRVHGRDAEANRIARDAMSLFREQVALHGRESVFGFIHMLADLAEPEEARPFLEWALERAEHPGSRLSLLGELAYLAAEQGGQEEAVRLLLRLEELAEEEGLEDRALWFRAPVLAFIGARDEAVALLRAGLDRGRPHWEMHMVLPPRMLRSLDGHPDYERLVRGAWPDGA